MVDLGSGQEERNGANKTVSQKQNVYERSVENSGSANTNSPSDLEEIGRKRNGG